MPQSCRSHAAERGRVEPLADATAVLSFAIPDNAQPPVQTFHLLSSGGGVGLEDCPWAEAAAYISRIAVTVRRIKSLFRVPFWPMVLLRILELGQHASAVPALSANPFLTDRFGVTDCRENVCCNHASE